ncbi:hypothetical protein STCU_10230 [Strigomonas culicis]|uniref:Uncharacterized protein n=1 Tax=Strigomonas culicis TaxID=28005 RepID=S9TIZ4_9TRYP|nr:hypothetical protein STCU_10230 [Strigomonas culicis]|eukprot:EPY18042.1 hypothetical protein STCU_10230 [Strigomonas culicis]
MSFHDEEPPAPVCIWTNSQGPMSFGNDGPFQDMEMQQMVPRGSFMRQGSFGGMNERQFSSNQMQDAFDGCNSTFQ